MRKIDEAWQRRQSTTLVEVDVVTNVLTVNMVHSLHLEHLYLSLCDAVEAQRENDPTDFLVAEFQDPLLEWHKEETLKLGVVSLYHFWERRLREFLRSQFSRLGRSLPKEVGGFFSWAQDRVERDLRAEINPDVWDSLDEARQIVNCVKHGDTRRFAQLSAQFPQYFSTARGANSEDPADSFYVPLHDFERLAKSFREFWESLPHKLSLKH